jgi:hypothetical protein
MQLVSSIVCAKQQRKCQEKVRSNRVALEGPHFSNFPQPKKRKQAVQKTRRKHVEKEDLLAIAIIHYRANTGPLEAIPSL